MTLSSHSLPVLMSTQVRFVVLYGSRTLLSVWIAVHEK